MLTFYRDAYTQIEVTISASESLGLLDSDYVEDYYGVDGQLTLRRDTPGFEAAVLMFPDPLSSPSIPNDVFRGLIPSAGLADGSYSLLGRVRDTLGNYTVLGSFQGGSVGNIANLNFKIFPGQAASYGGIPVHAGVQGKITVTLRGLRDTATLQAGLRR